MTDRIVYSFILDAPPVFTYQGWHLARSIVEKCGAIASQVHIHCTAEVEDWRKELFAAQGYNIYALDRVGDGMYCNKIGQLPNMTNVDFDTLVLLDTDTILVSDLRPLLPFGVVAGKIVDGANPSIEILEQIAFASGLKRLPPECSTDVPGGLTFSGNFNGGLYVIPKAFGSVLSQAWSHWCDWLLNNLGALAGSGYINHIDQIAFWLSVQHENLPLKTLPSNANYFTHMGGEHLYFDEKRDIALLHYHANLNALGLIEEDSNLPPAGYDAVLRANKQIGQGFDSRVFWDLRYSRFPERGSGVGSRGENLDYKRTLLASEGIETATSILDVGCGDLEVIKSFKLRNYLGLDVSPAAIERARLARPDLTFQVMTDFGALDFPSAELVLCFEVVIHQPSRSEYLSLISTLARATERTLLISGHEQDIYDAKTNHMIHYYEPLSHSLAQTGRFTKIECIGRHTTVSIFRCSIESLSSLV